MNSRANCSSMWLGTTYIGFLISPACFIFMPVAAMVKVLPAPTHVGQQRVAAAHAPPDGVLLVRVAA